MLLMINGKELSSHPRRTGHPKRVPMRSDTRRRKAVLAVFKHSVSDSRHPLDESEYGALAGSLPSRVRASHQTNTSLGECIEFEPTSRPEAR